MRHAHGLLCGEPELAHGLLLQRGGDERRRRLALALFTVNLADDQRPVVFHLLPRLSTLCRGIVLQRSRHLPRPFFVRNAELLDFPVLITHQPGRKFHPRAFQVRFDSPVLTGLELFNFLFAFDDHPQGGALDPAGGESPANLLPQ